jgi:DNA-binding response OmpR family regulator
MPGLGGLELSKELRKYNKNVKVLLITGYLVEESIDYEEMKEAGIDMVLEKPFHFKQLTPILEEILAS